MGQGICWRFSRPRGASPSAFDPLFQNKKIASIILSNTELNCLCAVRSNYSAKSQPPKNHCENISKGACSGLRKPWPVLFLARPSSCSQSVHPSPKKQAECFLVATLHREPGFCLYSQLHHQITEWPSLIIWRWLPMCREEVGCMFNVSSEHLAWKVLHALWGRKVSAWCHCFQHMLRCQKKRREDN